MEIILGKTAGFCYGVTRAVDGAKEEVENNSEIYCLGEIVHNKNVVRKLEKQGIKFIDKIEEARGKTIIRAHGIPKQTYEKAIDMNIEIKDLTCPHVLKIHKIAEEYRKKEFFIVLLGKKNHPEAEAVLAISDHIHLITSIDDLNLNLTEKLFVTNQTTMSILEIEKIIEQIEKKWPDAQIMREICNATSIRQKAVLDLKEKEIDLLIVVGDPHSNNTTKLKALGSESGIAHVIMIESVFDLNEEQIKNHNRIAITSGASTPTLLTNQVIETLKHFASTQEFIYPEKNTQLI